MILKGQTSRVSRIIRACLLGISVLLWAFISYCYWQRPDSCAAVTLWPVWVWFLPGVLLSVLSRSPKTRAGLLLILLWIVQIGVFSEDPWSMLRSLHRPDPRFQAVRRQGGGLRVVTLNCAGGSLEAASEVAGHEADIVLLQESPSRAEVEALGRRLFGEDAGILPGLDASILAKGRVSPVELDPELRSFFSAARVRLDSGMEFYVVSTRLTPPIPSFDIWSGRAWKEQKENRTLRAEQVRLIAKELRRLPDNTPIILGGDLNAPAGDGAFRGFRPRLHDAFPKGGRGWGNTALNDFPVSRIDQIWTTRHFVPISVTAHKTCHSDHRMVVADLLLHR